jgi:hypothetical protein
VPEADIAASFRNSHYARRNGDAKCLSGLEVDHKLELGRLHNRQVGSFLAFENSPDGAGQVQGFLARLGSRLHLELLTLCADGSRRQGRRPKLRFQNISGLPQGPAGRFRDMLRLR